MWRRELIRLVLALNWCVAGLAFGLGWYPHFGEWWFTARDLGQAERGEPIDRSTWQTEHEPRAAEYRQLTESLYRSGSNGWLWVSGTCVGTAVLLMVAFPKKPAA